MIHHSISSLIGNTPLLEPQNYNAAHRLQAKLLCKLEYLNPAGSVKDRVARSIIDAAEKSGKLAPGGTIIEPTSGNTGIGLAALAAGRGYRAIMVMPDTMSVERRNILRAYGAEIVLTPGAEGMRGCISKAEEMLQQIPGAIIAGQFDNPANPAAHYATTGPEIWADTAGKVDILVATVGTGGTLSGTGKYLKEKNPQLKVIAVEPAASPLLSGGTAAPHAIQGIGANFIPATLDTGVYDEIVTVDNEQPSGESDFSTLAKLYSEDGSARMGGELGYTGRNMWVPEFANVAFSLNDPKKVSKIVRTEFGFHIIQLIDKRGDKVNVRHILLKPQIEEAEFERGIARLDSIADDIRAERFTFDAAAYALSDDKDTRNNHGLMANVIQETRTISSRFQMKDLPQDVAKVVDTLQVGQVSRAFRMTNQKGQTVCAIVRLKSRIDGHHANMTEDFQVLRDQVIAKRREEKINNWIKEKVNSTYVRISPDWRNCDFKYEGWVKTN